MLIFWLVSILLQGLHPITRNADQEVGKTGIFNTIIVISKVLE